MFEWFEAHPGLAGWVQAVGSLITLWLAFLIPGLQRQATQREAEAALAPLLMAALDALHFCYLFNEENEQGAEGRVDLRAAVEGLNAFPVSGLRIKVIRPFNQFRTTCAFLLARFEAESKIKRDFAPLKAIRDAQIQMYSKSALEYVQSIEKCVPRMNLGDSLVEFWSIFDPELQ